MADAEYIRPTGRGAAGQASDGSCWRDEVQVVRNLDVMTTGKHKVPWGQRYQPKPWSPTWRLLNCVYTTYLKIFF
jgi:hypothetical protein